VTQSYGPKIIAD